MLITGTLCKIKKSYKILKLKKFVHTCWSPMNCLFKKLVLGLLLLFSNRQKFHPPKKEMYTNLQLSRIAV